MCLVPDVCAVAVLTVADRGERDRLADLVARVVQLDPAAVVRLVRSTPAGEEPCPGSSFVTVWASTPFGVLVTRSVPGELEPADVVTQAVALLTALAVERADAVDPGSGGRWRGELPPETGWSPVAELPPAELLELTERVLVATREGGGHAPSGDALDRTAVSVTGPSGPVVRIAARTLLAVSGLGLLDGAVDPVRVSATGSWLRLDAALGSVAQRRTVALPLLL